MNASDLQVRVARKATEALDIATFELVNVDDRPLPAFSAGSHVDVHLGDGLTRQYSLCNDPSEGHRYLIGVLRDPASRGGSQAMHERIKEGDVLHISPPKNHFPLAHNAEPQRAARRRHRRDADPVHGRAAGGHRARRSRCTTAPARRIAPPFAIASRRPASQRKVQFHFDDGDAAQKLQLDSVIKPVRPGVHLYVCGPKGFMDWVLDSARKAGWPSEQLHYEFFGAEVVKSETDASFEVKLASSGKVITVTKDQTVVQALSAAGVEVATSCEQGVCGTCLTRVLEGEIDHKDMYLTPEEQAANDQFLPCCSRAKSPLLVLDL